MIQRTRYVCIVYATLNEKTSLSSTQRVCANSLDHTHVPSYYTDFVLEMLVLDINLRYRPK